MVTVRASRFCVTFSPHSAPTPSGRLLPAVSGSPAEALPPLMPAPLAPHTARSSHAPCARRHSAGEWSCGCTWCPTRERCPTRSGSACPQGWWPRGGPRISIPSTSPSPSRGKVLGPPLPTCPVLLCLWAGFPHWRTTSESLIGVSVLTKATLIIVWSVVMRFNTLIKTLVQNCFLDNCFVACLFLLIIAAAAGPWLTNRLLLSHIPLSSTERNQITP